MRSDGSCSARVELRDELQRGSDRRRRGVAHAEADEIEQAVVAVGVVDPASVPREQTRHGERGASRQQALAGDDERLLDEARVHVACRMREPREAARQQQRMDASGARDRPLLRERAAHRVADDAGRARRVRIEDALQVVEPCVPVRRRGEPRAHVERHDTERPREDARDADPRLLEAGHRRQQHERGSRAHRHDLGEPPGSANGCGSQPASHAGSTQSRQPLPRYAPTRVMAVSDVDGSIGARSSAMRSPSESSII
jgi:hypothetical protein